VIDSSQKKEIEDILDSLKGDDNRDQSEIQAVSDFRADDLLEKEI
jgi:hypothetical protein